MWGRSWSEEVLLGERPEGRCLESGAQGESGGTSGSKTPATKDGRWPKNVPEEQGAAGSQGTHGVTCQGHQWFENAVKESETKVEILRDRYVTQ